MKEPAVLEQPASASTVPAPMSDDTKKRIDILLKEYDALRQEILGRINHRFGIIGLLTALAAVLSNQRSLETVGYILGSWIVVVLLVWARTAQLLNSCCNRLVMLERRINGLAGETLLEWETTYVNKRMLRLFGG